jgi:hypothetical protein
LEAQLLAILSADPANAAGPTAVFPLDGSGLDTPDSGITLYQEEPLEPPLRFPPDGSGLPFPGDGSGIAFPATSWVEVVERPADYAFDVYVRSWLAFDRPAFARAVARFRRAGLFEPTVTETETPHS